MRALQCTTGPVYRSRQQGSQPAGHRRVQRPYRTAEESAVAEQTEARIERALQEALAEIAPEADVRRLDAERSLHAQLGIDSVDFLRFQAALERTAGVPIPGAHSYRLSTPAGCRRYLHERLGTD
nr:acyl carrier protein [Halorhodospira sp. 9621]